MSLNFNPFNSWTGVDSPTLDGQYAPLAYAQAGSGAPNSVVTGSVGDRYIDTAATLGARVWYKASGTATNTGWLVAEGDTGWRNVASLVTPEAGVTISTFRVRRLGDTLSMDLAFTQSSSASAVVADNCIATVLPVGMRPTPSAAATISIHATGYDSGGAVFRAGTSVLWHTTTDADAIKAVSSGVVTSLRVSTTMPLDSAAWPASLPGSAA